MAPPSEPAGFDDYEQPSDGQGDPLAPIAKRIGARFLDWSLLMAVWLLLGAATSERLEDAPSSFSDGQ